jgi:hypothetical protein
MAPKTPRLTEYLSEFGAKSVLDSAAILGGTTSDALVDIPSVSPDTGNASIEAVETSLERTETWAAGDESGTSTSR